MSSRLTTSASFTANDAKNLMWPFASTDNEWGWTHYGFYILDLPAPLSYFNANTVIGTAGSHSFNRPVDERKNLTDCRRDCSLHVSTGGNEDESGGWTYGIFDTADPSQAVLTEDGSLLRWKEKHGGLEVLMQFPHWRLKAKFADWEFDLTFRVIGDPALVTHFAKMPKKYEHFSLMARAEGRFRFASGKEIVSGDIAWPANIEYARSITPQMLSPIRLPTSKMVPDTMFTYQILTVQSPVTGDNDNCQILIARTGTRKAENIAFMWLRSEKNPARNAGFPAKMRISGYKKVSTPGGDAQSAIVPSEIEWTARMGSSFSDSALKVVVFLGDGKSGNLWRGKFGAGFNTGCQWVGEYEGQDLLAGRIGSGHVEWVDTEASEGDLKTSQGRRGLGGPSL